MALFDDKLAQDIVALVWQRYQDLAVVLEEPHRHERSDQLDAGQLEEQSALHRDLTLLIAVANGAYHRTDALAREVELALTRVQDVLLGNALHTTATIPGDFWKTDMGVVVSRARWWISVDDLITISNAAALAFGDNTQANRMRIARAMDQGLLDWVPDPTVANPQQNRRVLRPQVERLRDQRRLPD